MVDATPIGAEESEDLPARHVEVDPIDRSEVSEALRHRTEMAAALSGRVPASSAVIPIGYSDNRRVASTATPKITICEERQHLQPGTSALKPTPSTKARVAAVLPRSAAWRRSRAPVPPASTQSGR